MNNATWIPGAGAYVYNGKVVSQNPIYDSNGKQVVEVPINQLNSNSNQTVNANNVQNQTGATISETATANKPNTDMQTAIGSLGTTNTNTAITGTAVSTPATNSPQTTSKPQDAVQQYITDYSTALANQDLSGQINALIELDKYTVSQGGQPQYSEIIGNLQKQNTEQVTNTINEYAYQISEAMRAGNTALVSGLQQELASFKQDNDYASVLQNKQAEIETEYSFAYMQGINDITNGILSLLGQYGNFQYDPYSDPALQMAQGYATSAIKEQMNSTGMYYSSMTQSAITKAINELIPVYEQMAKDEILQNINLLQSTASYLLNLEKAQFDMWASQIELKFSKNQERREEIKHAWDRVNNLGYVDNEASLVLGVDVGTLSPDIRKMMLQEEATIRAEERALIIDKKLALFKAGLTISATTNSAIRDYTKAPSGDLNLSQLLDTAQNLKKQDINLADLLAEVYFNAKDLGTAYGAIASANVNGEYIFDNEFIRKHGLVEYSNFLEMEKGKKTPQDILSDASNSVKQIMELQKINETDTEDEKENKTNLNHAMIQKLSEDSVAKIIEENATKYSDKPAETQALLTDSINNITAFSSALYENNSDFAKEITIANYEYLFDTIADSNVNGKNEFDYKGTPNSWEGNWAKDVAIKEIIKKIKENNYYGKDTQDIVSALTQKQAELKSEKKIG